MYAFLQIEASRPSASYRPHSRVNSA